MHQEFRVHRLNEKGLEAAGRLAESFDALLSYIEGAVAPGRSLSTVRMKLEEACFFAKKALAETGPYQA